MTGILRCWHRIHTCVQWDESGSGRLPEVFESYLAGVLETATHSRRHPAAESREGSADRTWERGPGGEYVPKEEPAAPAKDIRRAS